MNDVLIKVKYMAVHCDNYQDASGKVFVGEEIFKAKGDDSINSIFGIDVLKAVKENHAWLDNFSIMSFEIVNPKHTEEYN